MKKFNVKNLMYASWFGISNPWGSGSFTTLSGTVGKVTTVANWAISLSALVAVAVIIYGAYNLITSAGDDDKVEKGQKAIQSAIVGMIIVFLARLIVLFVVDYVF